MLCAAHQTQLLNFYLSCFSKKQIEERHPTGLNDFESITVDEWKIFMHQCRRLYYPRSEGGMWVQKWRKKMNSVSVPQSCIELLLTQNVPHITISTSAADLVCTGIDNRRTLFAESRTFNYQSTNTQLVIHTELETQTNHNQDLASRLFQWKEIKSRL